MAKNQKWVLPFFLLCARFLLQVLLAWEYDDYSMRWDRDEIKSQWSHAEKMIRYRPALVYLRDQVSEFQ